MTQLNKLPKLILATFAFFALSIGDIPDTAITLSYQNDLKTSSKITHSIEYKKIDREESLREFFKKYNSPLANNAKTFVEVADKYSIDYKLLPAISCVESTCAKFYIKANYNPFGWGSGLIKFGSFDEAIQKVGKGLQEIYLARGLDTVEEIAPVYTPPSYIHWQKNVRFFMNKIESVEASVYKGSI